MKCLVIVSLALAAISPSDNPDPEGSENHQAVGTRFLQGPETADAGRARMAQKSVARCIYDRAKDDAVKLLTNSSFNRIDFNALGITPDKTFDEFEISNCLDMVTKQSEFQLNIRFQQSTMRNLIAEEAYLDTNRDGLAAAALQSERVTTRPEAKRADSIAKLEDCLTFNGAQAADALLRSRPTSKAETEAFAALEPTLRTCMKSDRREMTLNISLVLQMLADGMWARGYYAEATDA